MHATKTARTDDSDAKRKVFLLDLNNKIGCFLKGIMGWLMGLEPTTTVITIRDSTN